MPNGGEEFYTSAGNGNGAADEFYYTGNGYASSLEILLPDPAEGQTGGEVGVYAESVAVNESLPAQMGTAHRLDEFDRQPVPQVTAAPGSPDLSSLTEISRFIETTGRTAAAIARTVSDVAVAGRRAVTTISGPLPPAPGTVRVQTNGIGRAFEPIAPIVQSPATWILVAGLVGAYVLSRSR